MTPHARLHAERLLAAVLGLTVTSAYRSPQRNRAVGGSPSSYHVRGRAVDLAGSRVALLAARDFARFDRVGPRCTGTEELFFESRANQLNVSVDQADHLHIAW